jgi:hypothetical protein
VSARRMARGAKSVRSLWLSTVMIMGMRFSKVAKGLSLAAISAVLRTIAILCCGRSRRPREARAVPSAAFTTKLESLRTRPPRIQPFVIKREAQWRGFRRSREGRSNPGGPFYLAIGNLRPVSNSPTWVALNSDRIDAELD